MTSCQCGYDIDRHFRISSGRRYAPSRIALRCLEVIARVSIVFTEPTLPGPLAGPAAIIR